MAADPFNSQGGYTTGIPPVPVIDSNGNVVTNVNNLSGNVAANNIYGNNYFFANGQPLSLGSAGANTQVQFNDNGQFGGSSGFAFDKTTQLLTVTNINTSNVAVANLTVTNIANLGDASNVKITGGVPNYVLTTDGNGNLSWAPGGGGGGNSFSGFSGFSGVGLSGLSGFSGLSGISGASGAGESGASGFSGLSGQSSFSGVSGVSGFSGNSGLSGFSGFGSKYVGSSTSSFTIGGIGQESIFMTAGLTYTIGQSIILAYDQYNYQLGQVIFYN